MYNVAKDKDKEKDKDKVKNYSDKYNPYWDFKKDDKKEESPDIPEYHIYISHQKLGTETAAVPYEDKGKDNTKKGSSSDNSKTSNKS